MGEIAFWVSFALLCLSVVLFIITLIKMQQEPKTTVLSFVSAGLIIFLIIFFGYFSWQLLGEFKSNSEGTLSSTSNLVNTVIDATAAGIKAPGANPYLK